MFLPFSLCQYNPFISMAIFLDGINISNSFPNKTVRSFLLIIVLLGNIEDIKDERDEIERKNLELI